MICGASISWSQTLSVGGDMDDPPYEYLVDGVPTGFNIDIFKAVAEVMGLKADIRLGPWDEVRSRLEHGEYDMLLGMYKTPERDESADFSKPHLMVNNTIFIRRGSDIRSLDDINNREVIVQNKNVMHDFIIENGLAQNITTTKTQAAGLRLLASGKHDCFIGAKLQGLMLIRKFKLDNIIAIGRPIYPRDYCFAVREGDTDLLNTLNEGLAIIKQTGKYDEIYDKWFGVVAPRGVSMRLIITYTVVAIVPVLAIFLVLALWSWSLKREVNFRTRKIQFELEERLKAESALIESEMKYRDLFESSRDALVLTSLDGWVTDVNREWLYLFGYTRDEALRANAIDMYANQDDRRKIIKELLDKDFIQDYELMLKRRDGKHIDCLLTTNVHRDEKGDVLYFHTSIRDITRRKQLEKQLFQSMKMESVGRLAGGVAHDFNNLLTAIIGNTELLMQSVQHDSPMYEDLEEIKDTSERAATLTRQLLAFSRRQVFEERIVDVSEVLRNINKLLQRLIGEDIKFTEKIPENLWRIKIDTAQMEQVFINLAINARDAMPDGGSLIIEAANVSRDGEYTEDRADFIPGDYIMIAVTDTGIGMDDATKARIFEPFFTTKEQGKGTGLGLATCYGIIRQSGGHIYVYSEPGVGTTFKIYLPRYTGSEATPDTKHPVRKSHGGTETILVAEDEEMVRRMITRVLVNMGYCVYEAADGQEALDIVKEQNISNLDMLVTDMVMPVMGGNDLAARMTKLYPNMKVLYISGYTDNAPPVEVSLERHALFLQKPFAPSLFVRKVRDLLDATHTDST